MTCSVFLESRGADRNTKCIGASLRQRDCSTAIAVIPERCEGLSYFWWDRHGGANGETKKGVESVALGGFGCEEEVQLTPGF